MVDAEKKIKKENEEPIELKFKEMLDDGLEKVRYVGAWVGAILQSVRIDIWQVLEGILFVWYIMYSYHKFYSTNNTCSLFLSREDFIPDGYVIITSISKSMYVLKVVLYEKITIYSVLKI